jgi:hypothetical protein
MTSSYFELHVGEQKDGRSYITMNGNIIIKHLNFQEESDFHLVQSYRFKTIHLSSLVSYLEFLILNGLFIRNLDQFIVLSTQDDLLLNMLIRVLIENPKMMMISHIKLKLSNDCPFNYDLIQTMLRLIPSNIIFELEICDQMLPIFERESCDRMLTYGEVQCLIKLLLNPKIKRLDISNVVSSGSNEWNRFLEAALSSPIQQLNFEWNLCVMGLHVSTHTQQNSGWSRKKVLLMLTHHSQHSKVDTPLTILPQSIIQSLANYI